MIIMLAFAEYITDEGVRQVAKHKFVAGAYTPIDNLLNPFWVWCQSFIPRWISPNAVTLFGGVCAFFSTLIAIYADSLRRWWWYYLSSILFFIYQTADAVDGKHARISQQSTPLGHLVDHGLDAFVALMTGLSVTSVVEPRLESWPILFGFNGFFSAWFSAQWELYESGQLETVGITEMELLVSTLLLLPGIFGPDMFLVTVTLPWGVMELREITAYAIGIGTSIGFLATVGRVLWKTRRLTSLVSLTPWMLHVVHSALLFGTASARAAPLLTMIVIGWDACLQMTKMVKSSISHSPWPIMHVDAIPFLLISIASGLGMPIPQWLLLLLCAWQTLFFVLMWENSVRRICIELNIPFISEVPRKDS